MQTYLVHMRHPIALWQLASRPFCREKTVHGRVTTPSGGGTSPDGR